jgi:hypothetical protein
MGTRRDGSTLRPYKGNIETLLATALSDTSIRMKKILGDTWSLNQMSHAIIRKSKA